MALRLIIEDEEGATTIVPLSDEEVTIGREAGNTIQLTEQNVSRQHARLTLGPDGWVVEDLDSYNGVKINNVPVEGSVTLMEGDLVQIGDYHLALSENVERTTLNLDRPVEAANTPAEPFQAAPSVDLPRLSDREMAALQVAPSATADAGVATFPTPTADEPEDSSSGGGAGKWIALLLLIGLVGAGAYYVSTMNKGAAPQDDSKVAKAPAKKDAPASKATKETPAATAAAASAAPDGASDPTAADAKAPESAGSEGDDSDGGDTDSEGDAGEGASDSGDDESGDTPEDAGDDSSAEPDTPTKTPKTPKTKKKKKVEEKPQGDPAELLAQARKVAATDPRKAYKLAKQSYRIDNNPKALQLMGVSACKMGDVSKAKSAYNKVSSGTKKALAKICAKNGILLG